jgi:ADP-ribosylglycohydrolase
MRYNQTMFSFYSHDKLADRIRGCILGTVLGDAIGGPFEFGPLDRVLKTTGGDWIDDLYPYDRDMGAPHGVWVPPLMADQGAPAGTGTDDTRLNWLYLELAVELGRVPEAHDIAVRYLELYEQPESVFPGHSDMVRLEFEHWEATCRGQLGLKSALFPDLPPDVLRARALGLNFPILSGLIALTWVGLLFPGQPKRAYSSAFRAAFYDIGYAREAVGLLAAAISAAAGDLVSGSAQELYGQMLTMDPLHLGSEWSAPYVIEHLATYSDLSTQGDSDQEIARNLSLAFRHHHAFDAFRTLAVALLSVLAASGDPLRAILIAANHVGIDGQGQPTRYEDIDCYAGLAGAIAGALRGAGAFPAGLLAQVQESNLAVYGIDLEAGITRLIKTFFTR